MTRPRACRLGRGPGLAPWLALCALVWSAPGARARAFSDYERFPAGVQEGGGGGRLFTGSPADSYACDVCHGGGVAPSVTVFGLPAAGYTPGQIYDIELVWEGGAAAPHAMHVEIVNRVTGRAAGQVALADPATIDARGRCGSLANEDPADYILDGSGGRKVVGVQNCGASSLRFHFLAPNLPEVVFAGSAVRSGEPKASPDGDGVQNFTRVLKRVGEPNDDAASSCAASRAGHAGSGGQGVALLVLLAAALRVRARRRDVTGS